MAVYGYARVSTPQQNIERQIRNIKAYDKDAVIVKEVYTGAKLQGRKEMDKLLKALKEGDTVIFDSVSRMSRDAEEGYQLYEKLYNRGINLVFIWEPHINTNVYRNAFKSQIEMTGQQVDVILKAVNEYLLLLVREQIRLAFEQAEKEVRDLRQRTKEGIETARINGKQIGLPKGTKITTKKSIMAKKQIMKYNKKYEGSLTNEETWKLIGICKTSFYKYVREIDAELDKEMVTQY